MIKPGSRTSMAVLASLALALVVAACGSTVRYAGHVPTPAAGLDAPSDRRAAQDGGTGAAALPSTGGTGGMVVPGGDARTPGPTGGTAGGSGPVTSPGSGPATAPVDAARPSGTAAPRDPSPATVNPAAGAIRLGLIVPTGDPGAVFGITTQSEDYTQIARAIVDDVNERGGFGGRHVDLVIAESSQSDQGQEQQTVQAQSICVWLTEDQQVDLVAADINSRAIYAQGCYADHGTPLLLPGQAGVDDTSFHAFAPYLLPPWVHTMTHAAAEIPRVLGAEGVLTDQIGVLAYDLPEIRRNVEGVFLPAIARHGGTVQQTVWIAPTYEGVSAQTAQAVLRFKAAGIDLVLTSFATGGAGAALFMQHAETQGYRPNYGMSTLDTPVVVDELLAAPPAQLANVIGVGYDPTLDISNSQLPPSANEQRCWDLVNERLGSGYDDRTIGVANGYAALQLCELVWLLEAAFAPTAGRPYEPSSLRSWVEALGTSYVPVSLPRTSFATDRSDGAAVQRLFRFDARDCQCFTYTGDWLPIGGR